MQILLCNFIPKRTKQPSPKTKKRGRIGRGERQNCKTANKKNELLAPLTSMYVYTEREKNLQGNNIYHLKDVTNRTDEFLFYLLMPFSAREKVVQVQQTMFFSNLKFLNGCHKGRKLGDVRRCTEIMKFNICLLPGKGIELLLK